MPCGFWSCGWIARKSERNHPGVGNRQLTLAERPVRPATGNALVERRERLGGLVNLYHRRATRARDRLLAHDPAADRYSAAVALYALAIW
jgi:hypothetical protein